MGTASRDHEAVSGDLSIATRMLDRGVRLFELSGELDSRNADTLERALEDAIDRGAGRVLLDLSGLRFCDSSGLQAIVATYHRLTMAGGRLAIVCDDPRVVRIFHVTRLDRLLAVAGTRDEALGLLEPASRPSRPGRPSRRTSMSPTFGAPLG